MRLSRLLLLMTLGILIGCSRRTEEEPLLVGHVAPLSGRDRLVGEHTQRGMQLVLEELNEIPIAGRRVAIVHADSRGDPNLARAEVVRLATLNKVLAILGGEPDSVERLSAAVGPYSLPLLTAAIPPGPADPEGVFSLDVAPEFRGEVLARFADKEWKVDRAALVVDDSRPVCASVAAAFARKWRSLKKTVRAHSFDPKAEGLPSQAPSASAGTSPRWRLGLVSDAQVLVFAGTAKDFAGVCATFEKEKKTPKFIFAGEAAEWARLAADGDAGRGVCAASVYPPSLTKDGKQFADAYRKRFHEGPDLHACAGYELTKVIVDALHETRGIGGAKLREELAREREFHGLTGTFRFKQGHAVRPLYVLPQGQEEQAKEYKPESS